MVPYESRCAVCHLISGDLWAGAEVMAFNLLHAQANTGTLSVTAIVFNNGRLATELANAGIEVSIIEESNNSFPLLVYKVYRTLRGKKINILHSHRQKENVLALLVSFFLRGVRLVSTQHGMPENFSRRISTGSILTGINFFFLSKCFDRLVVVSHEIQHSLVNNRRFNEEKTITIHNGISLPNIGNVKSYMPGQTFTIGTAGRLVPVKDFSLFIAVADLLRNHKNIRFLLAGGGPLYPELHQKVIDLHLDNFTFLGHVDDMNSFYAQTNLFMNTSLHEGIPMTILEAMGRGIPVIAPSVGGIPEIFTDGIDGFLVKEREPAIFAEKSKTLALDPNVYRNISQAAKNKIESGFTAAAMAEKYINLYLQLL